MSQFCLIRVRGSWLSLHRAGHKPNYHEGSNEQPINCYYLGVLEKCKNERSEDQPKENSELVVLPLTSDFGRMNRRIGNLDGMFVKRSGKFSPL